MRTKQEDVNGLFNLILGKISGLNYTYRFSGTRKIKEQSVSEHSYWTAKIAGSLARYENKMRKENGIIEANINLALVYEHALYHDDEEVITGDINHVFKHHPEGRNFRYELNLLIKKNVVDLFENLLLGKYFYSVWETSHDDNEITFLIKMGDWLQLLQYSIEEIKFGNKEFEKVKERVIGLLNEKNDIELNNNRLYYVPSLIKEFLEVLEIIDSKER